MVNPKANSLVPESNIHDQFLLVSSLSMTWKKILRTFESHFWVARFWKAFSLWIYSPTCLTVLSIAVTIRLFIWWTVLSIHQKMLMSVPPVHLLLWFHFLFTLSLSFPPSLSNLSPMPLESQILLKKITPLF